MAKKKERNSDRAGNYSGYATPKKKTTDKLDEAGNWRKPAKKKK